MHLKGELLPSTPCTRISPSHKTSEHLNGCRSEDVFRIDYNG